MDAHEIVDQIRSQFPDPVVPEGMLKHADGYCIGGAACLYVFMDEPAVNFPSQKKLAYALRVLNGKLLFSESVWYAAKIIENNDRAYFEEAWEVLEEAIGLHKTID